MRSCISVFLFISDVLQQFLLGLVLLISARPVRINQFVVNINVTKECPVRHQEFLEAVTQKTTCFFNCAVFSSA